MNRELTLQPDNNARRPMGEGHLTEEQFGELIAASAGASPTEAHLQSCELCATELASLRECLTLYREASTAYAERELRRIPQVKLPARRPLLFPMLEPAYWAAAAAAIFLAALLPMQMHRHPVQPPPAAVASTVNTSVGAESDEALLEDVNQKESASVPAAMQALEDPTASTTSAGVETSNQTSN